MHDQIDEMSRDSPDMQAGIPGIYNKDKDRKPGGQINKDKTIYDNKETDKYLGSFIRLIKKDEENYGENIVLKAKIYDSIMKGLEDS